MINKRVELSDILQFLDNEIISVAGSTEGKYIDNLADFSRINETSLDWINPAKTNKQEIAEHSKARVILVDTSVAPIDGKTLIVVKNPKMSLAMIGNHFFKARWKPNIHPTAIIDPAATIGRNVHIGAYAVIGKATIGDNCVIDTNVRICDSVTMGRDCYIKSGAILGGEGFGYERDNNGNLFRFPQIGDLILGNDVEVGANTCIDRGALSDTIIGDHTKINNLCHIAHNNIIGKNVAIAGCVNVSGGNIIEDDVWIAPNSSIRGYVHIGEHAFIGMGAVIVKDVPAGETWVGNPARKLEKKT